MLLDAKASVNAQNSNGETPLFIACQEGHGRIAQLLLDCGAAIDQARTDGVRPIFRACQEGHDWIVWMLDFLIL